MYKEGGNSLFTAQESYYAGQVKKYATVSQGDFAVTASYAVVGIIGHAGAGGDDSCIRYEESKIAEYDIEDISKKGRICPTVSSSETFDGILLPTVFDWT